MKKWTMILVILVISHLAIQEFASADEVSPLKPMSDMKEFMESENLEVTNWEVYMREPLRAENGLHIIEEIKKDNPFLQLHVSHKEKAVKYILSYPQKTGSGIEQFIIVVSNGPVQFSELLYKVSGDGLTDETINKLAQKILSIKQKYFQKNTTIFSCMQSENNDNIEDALMFDKLKDFLGIKSLKMINEDDFKVFSGFTSEWNQKIPTAENREMNVQFAVRKGLGAKTTVTIGTPIVTSEY